MTTIDEFIEPLDQEMPYGAINLNGSGYKVDGDNGLKVHCELHRLKSVDYFCEIKKNLFYIEFTDLKSQYLTVCSYKDNIQNSNLDKSTRRKLLISQDKEVLSEFMTKFNDSYSINSALKNHFDSVPNIFYAEPKKRYLIVVAPFNNSSEEELSRFYDTLKDNIVSSVPECHLLKVAVIPLDMFAEQLEQA